MSITESVKQYTKNKWEKFHNELTFGTLPAKIFSPFWWIMERDRGTTFPFYFPGEKETVVKGLDNLMEGLDLAIQNHEPERYSGEAKHTMVHRLKYVLKHFHIYSNETMANLYFNTRLPKRDYERIENYYNQLYLAFLAFNTVSGVSIVALTNWFYRSKKASIAGVMITSFFAFSLFIVPYYAGYYVMDGFLSQYVRRLGYEQHIARYGSQYPRNVDYLDI